MTGRKKTRPRPRPERDDPGRDAPASPRLGRIHDRVLDVLHQVDSDIPADKALRQVFAKARDLGPSEREDVSTQVYGYLRHALRARDLLERAVKAEKRKLEQIDPPIVTRLRLLAHQAAEGATIAQLQKTDPYASKRLPGVLERIVSGKVAAAVKDPNALLAIETGMPAFVTKRLVASFGVARTRALAQALSGRGPTTLRVNRLIGTRDEARARIKKELGVDAEPTELSPDGLILPGPVSLRDSRLFEEGWVELQDEGSQIIALATGALPGRSVLDACAGAGGKTLALAAMMEGRGRLLAIDPEERMITELKKRLRRAKVVNGETLASDLEHLPEEMRGRFASVLVDAPCSGLGTLRRNPDLSLRLGEQELEDHIERQKRLLPAAISALEPGGKLVYATCSILEEENEAVVTSLLASDPRVRPLELSATLGQTLAAKLGGGYQVRIGPGPTARGPDGFYLALLERC